MAVSKQVTETPEATMARVKSELAAAGTPTGAARQAGIEQKAGVTTTPVPPGATPISGPSGLQGLTESQIWRDPNSDKIYKRPTTPLTAGGAFVSQVNKLAQEKITTKREELLSAPDNYDTQVALQRGKLYEALAEESTALTPEDLRWLSPDQQAAIRSGDKGLIKNAIIGLNSILQFRKDARDEEDAKAEALKIEQRADKAAALNEIQTLSSLGVLGSMDDVMLQGLSTRTGISTDAILKMAEDSELYDYKYSAGTGNSLIELVTDKKTGKRVSSRVIDGGSGGGGETSYGTVDLGVPVTKTNVTESMDMSGFDTYLAGLEEKAMQSFSPEKRKELLDEWTKSQVAVNPQSVDITKFDPFVQLIIKGQYKVSTLDQTEAKKYSAQINQAYDLGLIPIETTGEQQDTFRKLATDSAKSPSITGAEKMAGYLSIAQAAGATKTNQNDLALTYAFIKALDFGDSAVREGELSLAQGVQSVRGRVEGFVTKLNGGGMLGDKDRTQLISALESIVGSINSVAKIKQEQFRSQANVLGISEQWAAYEIGFNPTYSNSVDNILGTNGVSEDAESILSKYNVGN